MKSSLARYYKIRSDIGFFGFLILSWVSEPAWAKWMFFIFSIVVSFALSYTAYQAEKRNEP
mgnify:CR=1 FL=1